LLATTPQRKSSF